MKSGFLDKLIDRLDRLDPDSLQTQFLRLAREKGLLETIFHALQEGLVVLDGREQILFANRAAERMFGFAAEQAVGARMSRYLRDIEWDRLVNLDDREWSRLVRREIEVNYPEHRYLAFYVVPLPLSQPDETGGVVIFRDVTRERQNEAQSIESERLRAITLLAAGVAHEIGNPLNSLNIHLQLLQREAAKLPKTRRAAFDEMLGVSTREVARLDGIITQFLNAVRPVKPQMEPCSLSDLTRETIEFMKHEIGDRSVLVECDCPDHLPAVKVDRGQIRQVLFNLLKNAIEAMPGGGVLRVTLAGTDRSVIVTVRDTGVGIEPQRMSQIFEPYHTSKAHGMGLGMMIVQRIVRDHGGEIEIHSEPGRGTTVTLFLPRADRLVRLLRAHRGRERKGGRSAG